MARDLKTAKMAVRDEILEDVKVMVTHLNRELRKQDLLELTDYQ